ncbi:MAG: hypothetical protein ACTSW3_10020 [Promethearchaeota archaeon]
MINDKLKNIVSSEFLRNVEFLNFKIINENLFSEANEFIQLIKNIFIQNNDLKKLYPEVYSKFSDYLINAKFVVLDILDTKEIFSLISNNLSKIFSLPFYSLNQKIKNKLISIDDLKERDKFKNDLKNIFLKHQLVITKERIKIEEKIVSSTIENWLRDYNLALEFKSSNKLKKSQYFVNSGNIKKLSEEEKKRVKYIFNIYEKLQLSSLSPEGLEESFVAVLPNKEIAIYSEGTFKKVDPRIERIIKSIQGKENYNNQGGLGIPKTAAEKEIDNLTHEEEKYKEGGLERLAIEEEIDKKKKIDDLQIEINKYKENSLERRALEDELNKLKAQ